MKYKTVIVTARGGPEVITIEERELRAPAAAEARIRVLATPLVQDDAAARKGNRPWLPETPFVPGYCMLGIVDALGEAVSNLTVGDRVAALTNYGSHAEYLYWKAEELVQVPQDLDPARAVVLVLNYLVALQICHRVVQAKKGDKALIIGASGGVGSAFLDIGQMLGLKMYGLASSSKHEVLRRYGAVAIDYRSPDWVEVIRQAEPDGIDYVFNGMFNEYIAQGISLLKRGGILVQYGAPQTKPDFRRFLSKFILYNLLPNGKKIKGYGTHRSGVGLNKEDWTELFSLLRDNKIEPLIAETFPILEARRANEMLDSGEVTGTIVLLAAELITTH